MYVSKDLMWWMKKEIFWVGMEKWTGPQSLLAGPQLFTWGRVHAARQIIGAAVIGTHAVMLPALPARRCIAASGGPAGPPLQFPAVRRRPRSAPPSPGGRRRSSAQPRRHRARFLDALRWCSVRAVAETETRCLSLFSPCLVPNSPQILLCKKKILRHIKMSADVWSTKC
jgi:hypothetical protein